jgi:hypothetical protein
MPQGRAKKIQVQLLLTDFSLQFFDPPLRLARIGEVHRQPGRRGRHGLASGWTANTAKRLLAARLKLRPPVIQHPLLYIQFAGKAADARRCRHPGDRGLFERPRETPSLLSRHTRSPR